MSDTDSYPCELTWPTVQRYIIGTSPFPAYRSQSAELRRSFVKDCRRAELSGLKKGKWMTLAARHATGEETAVFSTDAHALSAIARGKSTNFCCSSRKKGESTRVTIQGDAERLWSMLRSRVTRHQNSSSVIEATSRRIQRIGDELVALTTSGSSKDPDAMSSVAYQILELEAELGMPPKSGQALDPRRWTSVRETVRGLGQGQTSKSGLTQSLKDSRSTHDLDVASGADPTRTTQSSIPHTWSKRLRRWGRRAFTSSTSSIDT